ncbi:MAG TPA: hypothetical protein VHB73_00965 [Alphaproteobacteria bacterium]|nr:hypothetical protein [Alphaproteobacteria bacterium]
MTRRSPVSAYTPPPRYWNARQVAARLARSEAWLGANLLRLVKQGFPPRDGVIGLWDSIALEKWMDRQSRLAPESEALSAEEAMLRAIENSHPPRDALDGKGTLN